MQNGKSAIARNLIDRLGFGSTEFHVLRPRPDVLAEWAWLFVRQERFRKEAKAAFRGAVGQQRVPQDFMENYQFPLPSLKEQYRIVSGLEEIQKRVIELRTIQSGIDVDFYRLEQATLNMAFRGELVPNEHESVACEGRVFGPIPELHEGINYYEKESEIKEDIGRTTVSKQDRVASKGRHPTVKRPLVWVLIAAEGKLTPEELFKKSGHNEESVEEFYEELKAGINSGEIRELRPNDTDVFLEAIKP
jgi:hypothetical protein